MTKRFIAVVLLLISVLPLTVSAAPQNGLPVPDWITTKTNSDLSVTVTISSPPHMIDAIDYYEYSTDGFNTFRKLSDTSGGEFIITETTEFSVRYYYNSICSPVYTLPVIINRSTTVKCQSTGIALKIPEKSSIPKDITVSAFEIVNGFDYNAAKSALPASVQFRMYSVSVLRGGKPYSSEEPFSYMFPQEGFAPENSNIYYMDSSKKLILLESSAGEDSIDCSDNRTGIFIVSCITAYKKGDMNNDGKVLANDARYALRVSAMLENCSQLQLSAGDINKNGKIEASDARKILRFAAHLDII
ncbi:MAG: dockerin type I repeat-containing protein [Clostridia bacterium]|nr:dockerin type I repeat-containing protein [Clostridia bacterium]